MTKVYKKYTEYKDSGIEWLGQIPSHWEVRRMKRLFSDYSVKNHPEAELLSVTQANGVVPRSLVENRMVMPSGNLETFKLIKKGDFAISLRSFEGGLEYSVYDGIISPAYTVLKSQINIVDSYFKYLFKSYSFISELQTSVVGIREGKNISFQELSYSFLAIPPLPEQEKIAEFLNKKTADIDTAIAQKEQLIELLKERKQILINKAVTRGLNPDAELKDSSIDWIGSIPKHWEVRKFRHLISLLTDYTANGSFADLAKNITYLDEPDFARLVRLTDIRVNFNNEGVYINEHSYNYLSKSSLNGGELLMSNVGAYAGYSFLMPDEINYRASLAPNMFLIKFKRSLTNVYAHIALNSQCIKNQLLKQAISSAQPKLNKENVRCILFILPPLSEQEEIANYIEEHSAKIDKAIALKQQEIEALKEYKATLIDSAVRGKICLV